MKNILITTDFSENSITAGKTALNLLVNTDATIHLLHVFSFPIVNSEVPEVFDFASYQSIKEKQLEKIADSLNVNSKNIKTYSRANFSLLSEVENLVDDQKIDLIVMGLTGSSTIENLFIGSNTIQMLTESKIPVLAIPKNLELKNPLKVGFAFDGEKINNSKNLDLFREFSKSVGSQIHAFHVSPKDNSQEIYNELKNYIPFEEFKLEIKNSENTQDGILEYITNHKIDILGLIPRKHSFFDRLFNDSYTKEIAKYSLVPIFSIPE
jgi:nucleotide-binding universal stress UspA family protein